MDLLRKLKGKSKSSGIREDDAAPLLQNDVLAANYEDGQSGFDSLSDDGGQSMAQQVNALKGAGRKGKARANELGNRRRDDLGGAALDVGKQGALIGADALLPGLGTGLGAVDSAAAVRSKQKEGRSGAKQVGRQAASTGAGFIPVIGNFIGLAESVFGFARLALEPAAARTDRKVAALKKLDADAKAALALVPDARERLAAYDGDDKAKLVARLDKAEARLQAAIRDGKAWKEKKSTHGTLPLLSGSNGPDSGDSGDFS